MFDKLKINKRYLNIGIITLIIGVILLFVYQVSRHSVDILLFLKNLSLTILVGISPIIYAFIVSYILYRPLLFIERLITKLCMKWKKKELEHKKLRFLSLLILIVLLISIIALLIKAIVPPLFQSLQTIGEAIPNFQNILTEWIGKFSPYFKSLHITEKQIETVSVYITSFLSAFLTKIFASNTNIVSNVTSFFITLFATLILTFYFLKDKEFIFKTIDTLATIILPPSTKIKTKNFLKDVHEVFGNFILGQLLDAIIVGCVSSFLLLIIGHPFAFLIGFIAALTNIIPFIGPIIGAALALILGLFTSIKLGLLGALLLIIYQQIDGNFVQPKILGNSIGLAPIWIFIAILLGGNFFGPLGMILAVPITALLKTYLKRYLIKTQNQEEVL